MSAIALVLILSGTVVIRGAIKGLSPVESFTDIFDRATGGGTTAGSGVVGTGQIGPHGNVQFAPNVERWRGQVAAHFPADIVNQALSVMECESRGNPAAVNALSGTVGLFQHQPRYWASRSQQAGIPGANIYDPNANIRVAAWLYGQSNSWSHWTCKPSV